MVNPALWENQAIKAAMKGAWDQAIEFNQKILKSEPDDTAALNRLARAHGEKGNLATAKKTYQKVLSLDAHNNIALKSLERLPKQKKKADLKKSGDQSSQAAIFLEEPGKTKILKLVCLASKQILSALHYSEEVFLNSKEHSISVTNQDQIYLGKIPDDFAHRLLRFIKGGNQYRAYVKKAEPQLLEIFIREISRAPEFQNQASFISHSATANSRLPK